jgi:hypothetical protein
MDGLEKIIKFACGQTIRPNHSITSDAEKSDGYPLLL